MRRAIVNRRQTGFTLLEVLIAVIVLSVGLLGLAGLQTASLRNNHSAFLRSQATLLAYDMLDRMRANREHALKIGGGAGYDLDWSATPPAPPNCTIGTPCTEAAMANLDRSIWLTTLAQKLPDGDGWIDEDDGIAEIRVRWTDRDGQPLTFRMASRL